METPRGLEAKIGTITFKLTWDGDIVAALSGGEQDRARKLVNGFKAAGENGAPKERRTRKSKQRGATDLEQGAAAAE